MKNQYIAAFVLLSKLLKERNVVLSPSLLPSSSITQHILLTPERFTEVTNLKAEDYPHGVVRKLGLGKEELWEALVAANMTGATTEICMETAKVVYEMREGTLLKNAVDYIQSTDSKLIREMHTQMQAIHEIIVGEEATKKGGISNVVGLKGREKVGGCDENKKNGNDGSGGDDDFGGGGYDFDISA